MGNINDTVNKKNKILIIRVEIVVIYKTLYIDRGKWPRIVIFTAEVP